MQEALDLYVGEQRSRRAGGKWHLPLTIGDVQLAKCAVERNAAMDGGQNFPGVERRRGRDRRRQAVVVEIASGVRWKCEGSKSPRPTPTRAAFGFTVAGAGNRWHSACPHFAPPRHIWNRRVPGWTSPCPGQHARRLLLWKATFARLDDRRRDNGE